jgi:hypothetical protein
MVADQRSGGNNQTNNGAHEAWTPGAKGHTKSGPMDHTYPQGPSQQQAIRGENEMGAQDPSRMGGQDVAAEDGSRARQSGLAGAVDSDLPGGSLQSQQTGGTGAQQGITDSHQRQMEQHSGAWGLLEQPVGRRDKHSGTDVHVDPAGQQGNRQAAHDMNPQNPAHPELQGGSLGRHHDVPAGTYQTSTAAGQSNAAGSGEGTGMAIGPHPTNRK